MSIHKRESVLRRNPYADRRSFIARAMGLSPIGDIASGGMSESTGTSKTLTWETATDWDNAVSESGVSHESVTNTDHDDDTTVKIGYSYSSLPYTNLKLWLPKHEDSGSTANDLSGNNLDGSISGCTLGVTGIVGNTAYSYDGSDDEVNVSSLSIDNTINGGFTFATWVKPGFDTTNPNGEYLWRWKADGDNNTGIAFNSNASGDIEFEWSNGRTSTNLSTNYQGTWIYLVGRGDDSSTPNLDIEINGTQVLNGSPDSSSCAGTANLEIGNGEDQAGGHFPGDLSDFAVWDEYLSDSQVQTLYDVVDKESTLTTGTKSFSSTAKPDLQNLSYSLNGESIVLDIIGSPGASGEEIVSQTLDGSSSYSLSWSNSHTDFRLKPKPSTSTATASPTFNRGELVS